MERNEINSFSKNTNLKMRKIFERIILYLELAFLSIIYMQCRQQQQTCQNIYPGFEWDKRSPESLGVDSAILNNALSFFRSNSGGVGTDEIVIVRNGYIIWQGPSVNTIHEVFSVTKTFTSTLLGVLVTDKKLNIDDLAVNYFPELDDGHEGQEEYRIIRFRDLATMTAGYQSISGDCWGLHLKGLDKESYDCTQLYTIPGKPEYVPRTMWNYDDQNVHMLGYILTRIAGKSLEGLFRERIADKIGMNNWDWSDYGLRDGMFFNNPAGTPNNEKANEMNEIQGGIHTSALELARFGLLYLNMGNWDGEQLLDSAFIRTATTNQVPASLPHKDFDLTGRYGLYWWTNGIRSDGSRPWPSAPPRTAAAHGGGRNFCFVIPEWNMVIVRMSPRWESPVPEHGDSLFENFFARLRGGLNFNMISSDMSKL
jgi:CubicO group peptidase (beta-lactamase class C family)